MKIPSLFNSSCAYVRLEIVTGLANGLQLFSTDAHCGTSWRIRNKRFTHVVASLSYCDASTEDYASPCRTILSSIHR